MNEPIGGCDIQFNLSSFPVRTGVELFTNISIQTDTVSPATSYPENSLLIVRRNDGVDLYIGTAKDNYQEGIFHPCVAVNKVRVLFHNEFCTVYIDDMWGYTFSFAYIKYPETLSAQMAYYDGTELQIGTLAVSNVKIKELCDWRDAIYIDLETNAANAIQSIIQQRPVEIIPRSDGSIDFFYEPNTRPEVQLTNIRKHTRTQDDSKSACSDAIVYYSDVAVISDEATLEDVGFITRMIRVPELDSGALKAAKVIQKKARQSMYKHHTEGRINLALEIDDVATSSYTPANEHQSRVSSFIVESIQLDLASDNTTMTVEGRENG
jgi:hypothetical protein